MGSLQNAGKIDIEITVPEGVTLGTIKIFQKGTDKNQGKCWCEFETGQRQTRFWARGQGGDPRNFKFFDLHYCPVCGKALDDD